MHTRHNRQEGSVIVYSLLVLVATVSISMGLLNLLIPKLKMVRDAVDSTLAIYAADTAAELCLYEARKQPASAVVRTTPVGAPSGYKTILTSNAAFYLASLSASPVNITDDCRPMGGVGGGNSFNFRGSGYFSGVTRSLEITQ